MYDANPDAFSAPAPPIAAEPIKIDFHGQAGQYFRIWIVNVVLSILTLGIYSAWAKVRTKRYFYGNTVLDGSCFEYNATPIQILKGRLIAAALVAAWTIASELNQFAGMAITVAWMFLMPWVINLSLRFNARVSSYRNVRFDFAGSYGQALLVFLVLPVVSALTAGLLAPVAHRALSHYLARGYRFGGKKLYAQLPLGRFYLIYLQALGLLLLLILVVGVAAAASNGSEAVFDWTLILPYLPLLISLVPLFLLAPFIRTKVRNLAFNGLRLEGGHRFVSSLNPWRMVWITVSNLLVIVATLGLMVPWARIRATRYVAQNTAVKPASDLSDFVTELQFGQQAFGAELADIAGLDIGL